VILLVAAIQPAAALTVTDDSGRQVHLAAPAQRIVSLAPHITELLFAAGAGDRIVGTVDYSDFPPAARDIPRIGDAANVDLERLVALDPDLVILWGGGTPAALIGAVRRLGYPVYESEPANLHQIAASLRTFGNLAGTGAAAGRAVAIFSRRLARLRRRYAGDRPVRVFFQFWGRPIFTVNGEHFISQAISLCGGINIFAGLSSLTPQVGVEAVLAADPDIIIASGTSDTKPSWLNYWRRWPELKAVKDRHLYTIPPDLLLRPTPRLLDGAQLMCEDIDKARRGETAVSSK
jgi:iron complex transport system substrate-binding protein